MNPISFRPDPDVQNKLQALSVKDGRQIFNEL
jgi:hypothetical protein